MDNRVIKMIVLDIDGTIMDKNFTISDRVREIIPEIVKSGVKLVLATGRMYSATVPVAQKLGVTAPLITYQGSMVRNFYESDEILLHYTVNPELSAEVINELRKFDTQINIYLDDEMFVESESDLLKEYAKRRHIAYHKVISLDKILDLKPTKILAMSSNSSITDEIRDYLKDRFSDRLNITKSTPIYCEIVNKEASKGKAIQHLADMWEIPLSQVMAVGDQDNDKDMLEIAGLSVAMGNAPDSLKQIAGYVTDTVDNDGAVKAIEKFIFTQQNCSKE